jgi:cell wall assembly regulator SMI1
MCSLKTPDELSIKRLWERLETHLQQHNREVFDDLNPAASSDEVAKLEESLGFSFPLDFVAFLKIHNGQKGQADWLFDGEEFLSTTSIFGNWKILNRLREQGDFDRFVPNSAPAVKDSWWLPKWLPFTSNGAGDYTCLDLDPAPHGASGQVIKFFHDLDDRNVVASSFTFWFRRFVNRTVN